MELERKTQRKKTLDLLYIKKKKISWDMHIGSERASRKTKRDSKIAHQHGSLSIYLAFGRISLRFLQEEGESLLRRIHAEIHLHLQIVPL